MRGSTYVSGRYSPETYNMIRKVADERRINMVDALDFILNSKDCEKWRQAYNYLVEELNAEIDFVNKIHDAAKSGKYTADLWSGELAKVEKQMAELNEKIKALGIK